jgi:hypothetical protein
MKVYIKNTLALMIGLFMLTAVSFGQDIRKVTFDFVSDVRAGKHPPIPTQILLPDNAPYVLDIVTSECLTDSIPAVRSRAYEIARLVATQSTSTVIRIKAVTAMTQSCGDKHPAIVEETLRYLKGFSIQDFNQSAKDTIHLCLKRNASAQLLKLAGFLQLKDQLEQIRQYMQPGNPRQVRWSAILALSRMNDQVALQDLLRRIKKLPVNDDVVYNIFPDLIYTRQPEAIEYLVSELNNDAKNCLAADVEKETPILCGYRIMEQLSPVIEGYPLTLDESGDLETNDYATALTTVRHWFNTHKQYKILTDKF